MVIDRSNDKNLPTFDKDSEDDFRRPNIRFNWKESGPGPGEGETMWVSFLRQGFFTAVVDADGNTMCMTFVPRPKFKVVDGREIVEAETTGD